MAHTLEAIRLWVRLIFAAARFVCGGPGFSAVSTVQPRPAWLRRVTLVRMLGFRRREGISWPYRPRVARLVRHLDAWLPGWIGYRLVLLPLCAINLARMTGRNVARYGPDLRARNGMWQACQFADVLRLCLAEPGTFPTEYYVFEMHRPEMAKRAPQLANGYEVEILASLVRPAGHLLHGSGFVSEELEWLNDKDQFRTLCRHAQVSAPPSIAVFAGAEGQGSAGVDLPRSDLFLKPLRGGGGYGAARVFYDAASDRYRVEAPLALLTKAPYPPQPLSAAELVAWLSEAGRELPFILEPRLRAHPDLAALVGTATLPTLRVVTVADSTGRCAVLYAYLRSATADSPVDNVSSGGVAALVDPVTGRIGAASTLVGSPAPVHPLTGRTLVGSVVPLTDQACAQSLRMHAALISSQAIPVPIAGWDVAVTDRGPVFIEGNVLSDLSTPQKLLDRGSWSDETFSRSVLSWLAPIAGTRIALDPAQTVGYDFIALRSAANPSASM